jgi:ElaB/YqjD/DUF883 family membrane-anchored ribosome-binding protein
MRTATGCRDTPHLNKKRFGKGYCRMEERIEKTQQVDLERFINDLKTVVRDGQELLKVGMSGVREKAMEGARTTERTVRENPYRSLTMVFGLGVVVGLLAAGMLGASDEER